MSPIKKELDIIISQFFTRKLSYSHARTKIEEIVDLEVEKVKQAGKNDFAYREIVSLGAAKRTAFERLKRKKKRIGKITETEKMMM